MNYNITKRSLNNLILLFIITVLLSPSFLFAQNYNYIDSWDSSSIKFDTLTYYSVNITYPAGKSSTFTIYPIKDLTQKLKENIFLIDNQVDKIKDILREYEVKTYQANRNDSLVKQAANEALKNIENILTVMQKREWENAKDEWWESVNKELNLSGFNKNN